MQTSVESSMAMGYPGQLADLTNHDIATAYNTSKQLEDVTITAADLATTLTINGVAFTVNSGAATKTKTELRDLLIAAINAGSQPVTASIKDADELYVTADASGTGFTIAGTTNCTVANVIPNSLLASIPFGILVSLNDNQGEGLIHPPQAAGDVTTLLLGIALHTHAIENVLTGAETGYTAGSAVSVLRKGRVYVSVENAVVQNGAVYARHTASGVNTQLGAFRSDADTANASLVPGARFVKAAAAGGITIVEINLPQ